MKHFLSPLIGALLLVSCAPSPYGKLQQVKEYDSLSGDKTEGMSRITAYIAPSPDDPGSSVIIRPIRGRKSTATWHKDLPKIDQLDLSRPYQLDLLVAKMKQVNLTKAYVYRISDQDRILGDVSRCQLHDAAMHREAEDWIDGCELQKARVYPNSGIFLALCGSGMRHVVWVCPQCQKAQREEIKRLSH